jgi:hypothetical protein
MIVQCPPLRRRTPVVRRTHGLIQNGSTPFRDLFPLSFPFISFLSILSFPSHSPLLLLPTPSRSSCNSCIHIHTYIQDGTVRYDTARHGTVEYSTVRWSAAQYDWTGSAERGIAWQETLSLLTSLFGRRSMSLRPPRLR